MVVKTHDADGRERFQVIAKENEGQEGLMLELAHYEENVNNIVRSAMIEWSEFALVKVDSDKHLGEHSGVDIWVENPGSLFVRIRRLDSDDGFAFEAGEKDESGRVIHYQLVVRDESIGVEEFEG